ncbi:hypothetical protein [Arenibaculum sp.]|jgi:hypothetical protein|uniref:hypothetical protein n=1 Tax=Arenibaculum sp. TaxID=2865862 RepID=UPI002E15138B|nr:hypothetical protein [Arenibaculum sp.]
MTAAELVILAILAGICVAGMTVGFVLLDIAAFGAGIFVGYGAVLLLEHWERRR